MTIRLFMVSKELNKTGSSAIGKDKIVVSKEKFRRTKPLPKASSVDRTRQKTPSIQFPCAADKIRQAKIEIITLNAV